MTKIACPFKKGFKVQNRANAMRFLAEHVFVFDKVSEIPPNTIVVNSDRAYRVHVYCDSKKAMVKTPLDEENQIALSPIPVLMVHKPPRDDRVIVYELREPSVVGNITLSNGSCSVEWNDIRKLADRTFIIDLTTGEVHEYTKSLPTV